MSEDGSRMKIKEGKGKEDSKDRSLGIEGSKKSQTTLSAKRTEDTIVRTSEAKPPVLQFLWRGRYGTSPWDPPGDKTRRGYLKRSSKRDHLQLGYTNCRIGKREEGR